MPLLFSDTELFEKISALSLPDDLSQEFDKILDSAFILFSTFRDINGAEKYGQISLPVSIHNYEVVLKAEIIEIIASFGKGVPAFRASRTSIEALARVFLLLQENYLIINNELARNDKSVSKIESAATSKSASNLTRTFKSVAESYGLQIISNRLEVLYSELNDYTHGNPELDYQFAISEFVASAPDKLIQNIKIIYQMNMLYTYLLIFISQKVLGGKILSRHHFAYLAQSGVISDELISKLG